MNIGEEICGEWLRHLRGCEFVQYNLKTPDVQGEIDVIGLNLAEKVVYTCEVAVHLITGLMYVRNGQSDNVARLTSKFRKDIRYIEEAFPDYRQVFMLWSPVVKRARAGAKKCQMEDVESVVERVRTELGVEIELVVNERFQEALDQLRGFAAKQTKEHDSSVVRFLQVEEHLARHLSIASRRGSGPVR